MWVLKDFKGRGHVPFMHQITIHFRKIIFRTKNDVYNY